MIYDRLIVRVSTCSVAVRLCTYYDYCASSRSNTVVRSLANFKKYENTSSFFESHVHPSLLPYTYSDTFYENKKTQQETCKTTFFSPSYCRLIANQNNNKINSTTDRSNL